jgi:hypothetical protein
VGRCHRCARRGLTSDIAANGAGSTDCSRSPAMGLVAFGSSLLLFGSNYLLQILSWVSVEQF